MEKLISKIKTYSTEMLKEVAQGLSVKFDNTSEITLNAVLDVLMDRINEDDFIAFCDTL